MSCPLLAKKLVLLLVSKIRWLNLHMLYSMLYEHTLNLVYAVLLYKDRCTCFLCDTLTFSVSVLLFYPTAVFGRCVRYTCWQTRFRCVRLSGSGCLTPPASPVWRQVRGGHVSNVLSDLIPCEPSRCHWKPWSPYSVSAAQPWSLTNALKVKFFSETYTLSFGFNWQISVCVW